MDDTGEEALMLVWKPVEGAAKSEMAHGLRGRYVIEAFAGEFLLYGTGHDGLAMLDFPIGGRRFTRLDDARYLANRVDEVKAREAEVSGT